MIKVLANICQSLQRRVSGATQTKAKLFYDVLILTPKFRVMEYNSDAHTYKMNEWNGNTIGTLINVLR